jgi:hypothetical protein
MKIHPDSLNPRYKGNEQDVKAQCKKLFMENYVTNPNGIEPKIYTHDGHRVRFCEDDFYHAFFEGESKEKFSFDRARKVLWIKAIISGQTSGVIVRVRTDYPRRGGVRRLYWHIGEKYLVVLHLLRNGEFRFLTHYLPKDKAINKMIDTSEVLEII